jgi:hypothetical protein
MHVPRFGAALGLLLLAGLVPSPAPAADPGRLHDSRRGEGQIARGQESEKLDEATVELRDNGYAEIAVHSFRGVYRFKGTWRPSSGKQVAITINDAYGESGANAAGWISIDGASFDRIELDGRNGVGGKIAVSFNATGPGRPPQSDWSGLDSTPGGAGDWQYDRSRDTIDRVTVEMRRDGTGEIRFRARGSVRLLGRWSDLRPDSVRFDVTGGLDGSTNGSGTIRFRGEEVERVDLDGSGRDGRFRLEFRAGDRPNPPGGGGSNGRFTEEYGFDQPGADLRELRVDEVGSCQDACARDARCRAYTFNTRERRCYLKSEERPMIRRADCVTGVRRGGGGGGGLTQRDGYNLEGGDYTSVYQRSLEECQDACRRDRDCRAYTYNQRDRMCYLKDRVGNYSPRRDTVSGEKER